MDEGDEGRGSTAYASIGATALLLVVLISVMVFSLFSLSSSSSLTAAAVTGSDVSSDSSSGVPPEELSYLPEGAVKLAADGRTLIVARESVTPHSAHSGYCGIGIFDEQCRCPEHFLKEKIDNAYLCLT